MADLWKYWSMKWEGGVRMEKEDWAKLAQDFCKKKGWAEPAVVYDSDKKVIRAADGAEYKYNNTCMESEFAKFLREHCNAEVVELSRVPRLLTWGFADEGIFHMNFAPNDRCVTGIDVYPDSVNFRMGIPYRSDGRIDKEALERASALVNEFLDDLQKYIDAKLLTTGDQSSVRYDRSVVVKFEGSGSRVIHEEDLEIVCSCPTGQ